jgi:phosphotriesterase-related protein
VVQTVLGPIPAAGLGPTLVHEHLRIDLWPWLDAPDPSDPAAVARADARVDPDTIADVRANPFAVRDNLVLDDMDLAAAELVPFAAAGGRTVVDLTLPEIGRDAGALRDLARRTGLNIVMGCGRYIAGARPVALAGAPAEVLRDEILRDLLEGVPGGPGVDADSSGAGSSVVIDSSVVVDSPGAVRAGVIGEIGTSDPLHPDEARMLWAAGAAQAATGRGLVIHLDPWGHNAHMVLDHALGAGADPTRIMLAHLDPALPDLDVLRILTARGATVAIDIWGDEDAYGGRGMPTDDVRIAAVLAAFDEGWADRLAVSQDVCLKSQLRAHGGPGYAHLLAVIAPRLRAAGLREADLDLLFIANPRRLLAGDA